jgi:hypothetical protein
MFSSRQGFIFAGSPSTPSIVTDSLWIHLDAGNASSYSGSGTDWFDLSGNSRTGVLTNGPGYTSSDGGAITFDGADDFVALPTMTDSYTDFTIEAFVRSGTVGADNKTIWGHHTSGFGPRIEVDGNSFGHNREVRFLHGTNDSWYFTEEYTSDLIDDDTWYHIAATWAGTGDKNARIYVNGVEENATFHDITGPTGADAVPSIGSSNGQNWPGRVAITRFYTRALTGSEIAQNYNAQKSRFGL